MSTMTTEKALTKDTVKSVLRKDDMSPEEAVNILEYYDNKLKELGKSRTSDVDIKEVTADLVEKANMRFGMISMGTSFMSVPTGLIITFVTDNIFFGLTGIALTILTIPLNSMNKFSKIRQKFMTKKEKNKIESAILDRKFHEMKEIEYQKTAQKIVKKVTPAIEVLNANLSVQEFYYNPTLGSEGFLMRDKNLSQWEKTRRTLNSDNSVDELVTVTHRKEISA